MLAEGVQNDLQHSRFTSSGSYREKSFVKASVETHHFHFSERGQIL